MPLQAAPAGAGPKARLLHSPEGWTAGSLSSDTRQMGLDLELVREAERVKEQLAVSQHAAYRAKVDYHQAIRRLHAAGGSQQAT